VPLTTALLIPFFNEAHRMDADKIYHFMRESPWPIIFIDDGSTDETSNELLRLINALKSHEKHKIVTLHSNVGKTNAVRIGLQELINGGFQFAVLSDFDLPVSLNDLRKAESLAINSDFGLVSGARVRLAGSNVSRSPYRHWIGRMIATLVYLLVTDDMYDPQSPCKVYQLKSVGSLLEDKFETKWFGDLELLLRFKSNNPIRILEFPLQNWVDIPNGNLSLFSAPKVLMDLLKLSKVNFKFFRK
jgi:dolichyl-phosphate beta-glucosyltransferase